MDIEDARREIDRIDAELLELLRRRAVVATGIGRHKRAHGIPVVDPAREAEVLERAGQALSDSYGPVAGRAIFREILSASRSIQAALAAQPATFTEKQKPFDAPPIKL